MQPRAKFKRRCTLYNDYALTGAFLSRVVVVYDPRAGVLICAPCSVITVSFLGTTTGPHSTEAGALPSMRLHAPCPPVSPTMLIHRHSGYRCTCTSCVSRLPQSSPGVFNLQGGNKG